MYRGQTTEARSDERRERLLAAGLESFGTVGYAATSIEGLCAAAGVTARHFYEHFATRESLLQSVYDNVILETEDAVLRALGAASEDVRARAAAGVTAFVRSYLEDPRRARVACIEIIGVSMPLERHRRSVIRRFAGLIEAQARALASAGDGLAERNYALAGLAMAGGVNELLSDWIMRRDRPAVAVFTQEVVEFFFTVIEGAATPRSRG